MSKELGQVPGECSSGPTPLRAETCTLLRWAWLPRKQRFLSPFPSYSAFLPMHVGQFHPIRIFANENNSLSWLVKERAFFNGIRAEHVTALLWPPSA